MINWNCFILRFRDPFESRLQGGPEKSRQSNLAEFAVEHGLDAKFPFERALLNGIWHKMYQKKAEDLFFTLVMELLQKIHTFYYKSGGKNRFAT